MRTAFLMFLFAITASVVDAAPPFAVGPSQPMLIFPAPGNEASDSLAHADAVAEAWATLPDEIRPHSLLLLETPATADAFYDERFQAVMQEVQFRRIPVVLHVASGSPERSVSIEMLRYWLETYPEIQGVLVNGISVNDYPAWVADEPRWTPTVFRWLTDALRVTADADRFFILEMGELEWPRLMSHSWAEELLTVMRERSENVLALADSRGHGQFARVGSLIGLWMEDAVANWGLRISEDTYTAAHFVSPGVFGEAASAAPMPPDLYRAQLLTGASGGAAVYRFDDADVLWNGLRAETWSRVLEPTLNDMAALGAIARKDWLIRNTHVAYRLHASDTPADFHRNLADIDGVLGEGFLIRGAYGMERPGQIPEFIPNSGRYRWVPIMSPSASDEALSLFDEVVLPGAMLDARSWAERLNLYYPEESEGEALVSRVGRAVYVMHTHENHYAPQTFRVSELPASVKGIRAERTAFGVRLSWPFREGDLSYRVHRRLSDETDFTTIARDVEGRGFTDEAFSDSDVAYYSVTALTQETSPLIGTVNFGDYRLYSSVESRIEEVVELRRFETEAESQPLPTAPYDDRSTLTSWADPFVNETDPQRREGGRMALELLERMERAYHSEDIEALLELFSDTYADASLRDKNQVRAAFKLIFGKFRAGPVHRQARSGAWRADGRFVIQTYLKFTAVEPVDASGRFGDRSVAFPGVAAREVELELISEPDPATGAENLRIVSVNPPFPDVLELLNN